MNKNILRMVSGAVLIALLAGTSVAVAAADGKDKEKTPPQKTEQVTPKTQPEVGNGQPPAVDKTQNPNIQPVSIETIAARVLLMKNRNNAAALLDKLVAANKITQGDANKILKDWDTAHPEWIINVTTLQDRVMKMLNRDNVLALLNKLVAGGRLNQGDANKILKDWEANHANLPSPIDQLKTRIMAMQNRDNVVAVLNNVVAATKLTRAEADQILAAWDAAHPNWTPVNPIDRIMSMKNRNNVEAALDKMIAANKITQGDANKILKDWDAAHPGWILDVGTLHDRVMQMKNHDNVVSLLDKLVAGGRLNQGDANKILKDWEDAHTGKTPAVITPKPAK